MMKIKVLLCSLLITFLLIPSIAYAAPNEYGFDEDTQVFEGTYDNWENFVYELPPAGPPAADDEKGVLFVTRKFGLGFFDFMMGRQPLVYGAWQYMHFYEYLQGDKDGWTWNNAAVMVITQNPVEGAVAMQMGPDIYLNIIENDVWLTDPDGKTVRDEGLIEESNEIVLGQYPDDGFMLEPIHAIPQSIIKQVEKDKAVKDGLKYWNKITK